MTHHVSAAERMLRNISHFRVANAKFHTPAKAEERWTSTRTLVVVIGQLAFPLVRGKTIQNKRTELPCNVIHEKQHDAIAFRVSFFWSWKASMKELLLNLAKAIFFSRARRVTYRKKVICATWHKPVPF